MTYVINNYKQQLIWYIFQWSMVQWSLVWWQGRTEGTEEIIRTQRKEDEIKASLENGYLTITAEKGLEKDQKEEEGKKYICRERYSGSCQRTFYVGDEIEQDDIKASFKHGILRLDIPKKQPKPQVEEKKCISIEG